MAASKYRVKLTESQKRRLNEVANLPSDSSTLFLDKPRLRPWDLDVNRRAEVVPTTRNQIAFTMNLPQGVESCRATHISDAVALIQYIVPESAVEQGNAAP